RETRTGSRGMRDAPRASMQRALGFVSLIVTLIAPISALGDEPTNTVVGLTLRRSFHTRSSSVSIEDAACTLHPQALIAGSLRRIVLRFDEPTRPCAQEELEKALLVDVRADPTPGGWNVSMQLHLPTDVPAKEFTDSSRALDATEKLLRETVE